MSEEKKTDDGEFHAPEFFIGLFVGYIACAVLYMVTGVTSTEARMKREAVQHGVAEYVPGVNGESVWQWKKAR